jgi:hypothetical protein
LLHPAEISTLADVGNSSSANLLDVAIAQNRHRSATRALPPGRDETPYDVQVIAAAQPLPARRISSSAERSSQ